MMRRTFTIASVLTFSLVLPAVAAERTPWPEHPRPDFQRTPWVNLNGQWGFEFDPKDAGEKEKWFEPGTHAFARQITVPFPWESKLSGIGDIKYTGVAWYSREVQLPTGDGWEGKDAWLVIGACDFEAKVYVNGQLAGEHVGGYLPFEVNLSEFIDRQDAGPTMSKATITIRVVDRTDPQQPVGKQVHWYTRNSGIWQTVYLEPRPAERIWRLAITPDIKKGAADFRVGLTAQGVGRKVRISSPDGAFDAVTGTAEAKRSMALVDLTVKPKGPKLWSPESPTLYPTLIEVLDGRRVVDRVETYFGLREVKTAKAPGRDYRYIYLNGQPVYLRGALHQSFHPDGIYQYPDDAVVRSDYELCKKLGLNFLRIHIKTSIPRELYWADKTGILIMQDMPCFYRYTEQAQRWFEENLRGTLARDFNHPAIFSWVDFNETWGIGDGGYSPEHQKWVTEIFDLTKKLDPTRIIEDNSPCYYDHVTTDVNSWHFYINDYKAAKEHIDNVVEKTYPGSEFNYVKGYKQDDDPLINSEYGGIGAGSGDTDISWCFKFLTNELRRHDKICGYVYTELSDIEWEHNGFVNYDRSPKEYGYDFWMPGFSMRDLNGADFVVIDAPPCLKLKTGEKREVPIRISHWSDYRPKGELQLRWSTNWRFNAWGTFSRCVPGDQVGEIGPKTRPVKWEAFKVVDGPTLTVAADVFPGPELGVLQVELVDSGNGKVLARNYINLWMDTPTPRVEAHDANYLSLRFNPGDFSTSKWEGQPAPMPSGPAVEKAFGYGAGAIEYRLKLPEGVDSAEIDELTLLAEVGAKAHEEKLDWPSRKNPNDYPQTDTKKWPTNVLVTINGMPVRRAAAVDGPGVQPRAPFQKVGTIFIPDDPADARGVLSHVQGYQAGSYGWLVRWGLEKEDVKKAVNGKRELTIRFEVPASAEHKGGLSIYGDRLGAFPVDPTVTLHFAKPHGLAKDHKSDAAVAFDRMVDRFQTVIPTAENGGSAWRYTTSRPADDWAAPAFQPGDWKTGKSGFGRRETPNAAIGTRWLTDAIWLRTEFQLDKPETITAGILRVYHDEDAEIYINGQKVLALAGFDNNYVDHPLSPEALKALKAGTNTMAVHCRQTGGGQGIDVGLTIARE